MATLREQGLSYQDIGVLFNISRARVHQVLSGYTLLNGSKNGWYGKIKAQVLERAEGHCQICGKQKELIIHHIDGNDETNSLRNLIAVCRTCHAVMHRKNRTCKDYDVGTELNRLLAKRKAT